MDYLSAIADDSAEVTLGGNPVKITRAHLGLWFKLQEAQARANEAGSPHDAIFEIIALATGKDLGWVQEVPSLGEVLSAIQAINLVNRPRGDLPYMHAPPGQDDGWNYPNRGLTFIVHKLCSIYGGCTPGYVLEHIYPEEAFCYMQEILLDEHTDHAREYYMNGMIGVDDQGHKEPYPEVNWPKAGELAEMKGEKAQAKPGKKLVDGGLTPPSAVRLQVDAKGNIIT